MNETPWYILKQHDGHCEISQIERSEGSALAGEEGDKNDPTKQWGPFESQAEAIARRVGLIRAGKCLPS